MMDREKGRGEGGTKLMCMYVVNSCVSEWIPPSSYLTIHEFEPLLYGLLLLVVLGDDLQVEREREKRRKRE